MNKKLAFVALAFVAPIMAFSMTELAGPAHASTDNGSLLVPSDVAPGNYFGTPTDSYGGYVAVCSDYTCAVGAGMIKNYFEQGRFVVVVPANAVMVNVQGVALTPMP